MCYKSPGPRCSHHAGQRLERAKKALVDAQRAGDITAHRAATQKLSTARDEFSLTPAGIKQLRAEGKDFLADTAQARRDGMLAAYNKANPSLNKAFTGTTEEAYEVACGTGTKPRVLTALSTHPSSQVRMLVARNTATPKDTLGLLADEFPYAVASNPSAPPAALTDIALAPENRLTPTMFAAYRNPSLPVGAKTYLNKVILTPEGAYTPAAAAVLLGDKNTTEAELARLSGEGHAVASHRGAGKRLQLHLASIAPDVRVGGKTEAWGEHQALLRRRNSFAVKGEVLATLAATYSRIEDEDEKEATLSEILAHPNCPAAVKDIYGKAEVAA